MLAATPTAAGRHQPPELEDMPTIKGALTTAAVVLVVLVLVESTIGTAKLNLRSVLK
jgi:hypothetical protein